MASTELSQVSFYITAVNTKVGFLILECFFSVSVLEKKHFLGRCTAVFFCGENSVGRRDYRWWTRAEETFSSILERTSRSCLGAYQPKADFSGFSLSQPEGWQSQLTLSCIVNRMLRGAFFSSAHSD